MSQTEFQLKYGCNPHQSPARVCARRGPFPIDVLNGSPGYINLLDALNSWQLVKELKESLDLPAAASFKHVSPAGVAVGIPLSDRLKQAYFVPKQELSPLAIAYARARGADRMSSFGDWVALSDTVDISTAELLRREVSDGIIAPDYNPDALKILRKKKGGKFPIIQVDASYNAPEMEMREVFGVVFEQRRNHIKITRDMFNNIPTNLKEISDSTVRDMIVAQIALKYTQSNSVCLALDGQIIGMGAGQQSRIHCTRLASEKADTWWLRQHDATLDLPFQSGIKRPDKNNAVDSFLRDNLTKAEEKYWTGHFNYTPSRLTSIDKANYIKELDGVVLASDAFFPFRDNIDRASQSGVEYVTQPGGSIADEMIIEACNEYDMTMAITEVRLFHH